MDKELKVSKNLEICLCIVHGLLLLHNIKGVNFTVAALDKK